MSDQDLAPRTSRWEDVDIMKHIGRAVYGAFALAMVVAAVGGIAVFGGEFAKQVGFSHWTVGAAVILAMAAGMLLVSYVVGTAITRWFDV